MKKIITLTFALMIAFATQSYAEMRYGISAAITEIDASGTETEGGEKTNGSADNSVLIPSVFAEYVYSDQLSIGLDYIPMTADVSNKSKNRSDVETSVTSNTKSTTTNREQKANASLKNHLTLYGNYKLSDTLYLKAGIAAVTLETDESLGTGSKYGNEDVFGGVIGFGMEQDGFRVELAYTDYEDISLTSSVARAGVTTNNKIDADLDTVALKLSYLF